jgi:hypothetical protein
MTRPRTKVPPFEVDPTMQTEFSAEDLSPHTAAALGKEIHVAMPMAGWDELEFLADGFPDRVYEQTKGEVEGEEEGEWWVFYCNGVTIEGLLEQSLAALPQGWTAAVVPVPDGDLAAGRIEFSRT